jgi:LmbE family N-acetylglucosaminyl deacetylase
MNLRTTLVLGLLGLTLGMASPANARPSTKKHAVLAVFAHPDDETVVSPLLAQLVAEGHRVGLVIVTSGQLGTEYNHHKAGAELGAVREAELKCVAEKLGITDLTALGQQDQGLNDLGRLDTVARALREKIDAFAPDVIITWGPDGESGHPDHRLTGIVTSQVFFERYRLKNAPHKLYHFADPESAFAHLPADKRKMKRQVADIFVDTAIEVSARHVATANASYLCHVSQLSPEQKVSLADPASAKATTIHLRRAASDTDKPKREKTLFSKLK